MIYPRGATPPPKCRECNGTGMKSNGTEEWFCEGCNGTGIEGNPAWLILLFVVTAIVWAFALTQCS